MCFVCVSLLAGWASLLEMAHGAPPSNAAATADRVEFNRDIRPIFARHCVACHGGVKQAAELSFVYRDRVLPPDGWIVEPGAPDDSELIARVTSEDPDLRMPPPEHGPPLSPREIEHLNAWIEQGAKWQEHWAFVPPDPPPLPEPAGVDWCRVPFDRFVLARLESEGLRHSPEADRIEWLRRATFDLTGLPPTLEEVRDFTADTSEVAYETVVDRLLASPNFGERWAALWMDLARYADSQGYEKDSLRTMWPYRDWLIRAFNADMPFDEFTIRQLAGDMLPDATLDDIVATAFHRNTPTNSEGGTDDEEFRTVSVIDRVSTTWEVWQGLTFKCVQCHSHPYDPIEHDEFYQFLAVFNTSKDWDLREDLPMLGVPLDEHDFAAAREIDRLRAELELDQVRETAQLAGNTEWQPLAPTQAESTGLTRLVVEPGPNGVMEVLAQGTVSHDSQFTIDFRLPASMSQARALRIDALPLDVEKARHTPELGFVVTQVRAQLLTPAMLREEATPALAAAVQSGEAANDAASNDATSNDEKPAALATGANKKQDTSKRKTGAAAKDAEEPAPTRLPGEIQLAWALGDEANGFSDTMGSLRPDKQGWGANPRITQPRWLVVIPAEPINVPEGATLRMVISHNNAPADLAQLVMHRSRYSVCDDPTWSRFVASAKFTERVAEMDELAKKRKSIKSADLPVMAEQQPELARGTAVFNRGNWLDKTDLVEPGIPSLFRDRAKGTPSNRLEVARWLVSPENPLTARVTVNRFWEQLFGIGLVETVEDFGTSGQRPTHPELLDHLALQFQNELDWSMKALLREIVLSATYRQTAGVSAEEHDRDAANRLLARGPRHRLSAEMVRDNALAVSGLLTDKRFGPSVMPPQPDGIWRAARSKLRWQTVEGEDRYRRGIYTYWRRSAAYPSMLMFDAPSRLVCTARRVTTNTPLQALVTLNDPAYMECATAFAARMRKEADGSPESQIAHGYEIATGRSPVDADLTDLVLLYRQALDAYRSDKELAAQVAETPRDAAMTLVANAILNLDMVLTK